uniref:Little elongation complex subunit 2 C-terminal domain-containing protein n=2 Tax=Caenorhabditis japonica TaxID=281687 RepID=A0A8R1I4H4_CAEJA
MCQNLMYHGELQHNSNKRELKDMFKAAEPEYDTLAAAALEHARNETIHPIDYVSEKTLKFALHSFNRKAPPPANYLVKNPVFTIAEIDTPEGIQTEKQANPPKFEKLLKKPGWMDELEIPNMRRKCGIFKNKRLPALKVPLPDDKIATSLIELQDTVSVMMDATTIAHFLAPRWLGIEYDFGIPVKVVETMVNGKSKKIVTLSKPIPYGTISKSTVQRKTLKRMLKNQYVKLSEKCAQITTKFPENNAPETPADDPAIPSTSADTGDFLDDLIAGMDKTTTNSKEETTPTVETGYQYAVFSVGETKVVVRSRPPYSAKDLGDNKHDVLAKLPRISFEPRVEYLPNGGAMDLERSEWVWNYAKKVFKMSDAHLLYRCSYRADHVLQVDTMTMQPQLTPPPPGVWALLTARTVMLEQLISRLETLETGEYLAFQEKSKPLVVVPKSPDPSQGISTGVLKITENEVVSLGESIGNAYFHGFCQEVVFQWQIVQGRAPRMMLAKDSPLVKRLPSRTNREKLERHKNETKRKFVRREDEKNYVKRQRMPDLDDPNLYADFTNPAILQQSYNPQAERRGRGRGRGGGGGRGRGGRGKRGGRGRGGNGGSL